MAGGDLSVQFCVKVSSGHCPRLVEVVVTKAPTAAAETLLTSGVGNGTYRGGYNIATGCHKGTPTCSLG